MNSVGEHPRALVRGFIDGTLNDAEHAALEIHLRDPDTARHLLRELHFDQAIRVAASSQLQRAELEADPQAPITARHRIRRVPRWRPRLSSGIWLRNVAALLLVALLVGLTWSWTIVRQPFAQLVVHLGTVTVGDTARDGASILTNGDTLTVSPRGWASVRLDDGTLIELDAGSRMTLTRNDRGMRLTLDQGALKAEVRHQPDGRPLVIETARSHTTVLGTRLGLGTAADGDRLEVTHGLVRIARRSDGASIEVPGGQMVNVTVGAPLALAPIRPSVAPVPEPPRAGLLAWFDPQAGVERDDRGRVARWRERIRDQYVASSIPQQRPTLVDDERPAIRFAPRGEALHGQVPWPITGAFTVALALKPTQLGRWSQHIGWGWGCFAFHAQEDGGIYAGVGAPGGGIRFAPGSGPEDIPPGTAILGRWQRFIVIYGHGVGAFYADGNLIARKAMPAPEARRDLSLGRAEAPATEPSSFAGDLAELLLYDRALEPQEVPLLDQHLRGAVRP